MLRELASHQGGSRSSQSKGGEIPGKKKSRNEETILGFCLGCGTSIKKGQETKIYNGRTYHTKCVPKPNPDFLHTVPGNL